MSEKEREAGKRWVKQVVNGISNDLDLKTSVMWPAATGDFTLDSETAVITLGSRSTAQTFDGADLEDVSQDPSVQSSLEAVLRGVVDGLRGGGTGKL